MAPKLGPPTPTLARFQKRGPPAGAAGAICLGPVLPCSALGPHGGRRAYAALALEG